MKVKFNLPVSRYRNKISFDNNTSFGCGNLQPLFTKFVVPWSKEGVGGGGGGVVVAGGGVGPGGGG